jgi:Ca2+-binding RTX toxin-like protein
VKPARGVDRTDGHTRLHADRHGERSGRDAHGNRAGTVVTPGARHGHHHDRRRVHVLRAGSDREGTGGPGKDALDGGAGNDVLNTADRAKGDVVRCGTGRDTVIADASDKVAKDCEKVTRRR